jgi:hypothetical protein
MFSSRRMHEHDFVVLLEILLARFKERESLLGSGPSHWKNDLWKKHSNGGHSLGAITAGDVCLQAPRPSGDSNLETKMGFSHRRLLSRGDGGRTRKPWVGSLVKAITLLFGAETWVLTEALKKTIATPFSRDAHAS